MNFIYSIIIFFILSIISFSMGDPEAKAGAGMAFYGFGWVLGTVTFGFLIIGFFQNLFLREVQKRNITTIGKVKKNIKHREDLMGSYKAEMGDSLTKLYPDYEKEIFKTMSPKDAKNLDVFLAKYPELKFNGVLESFTKNLTEMLSDIAECKERLEDYYEDISLQNKNDWFILKIKIPEKIKKAIEAQD